MAAQEDRTLSRPQLQTFYNLIGQIDPIAFDAALCQWLNAHEGNLPRDLALDGKVLRGTKDIEGRRLALVALIEKRSQRLVAQQPLRIIQDDKESKQEGELTAARHLLAAVPSLEGATVTGDAMFARTDIAQAIVQEKGGDYLLALKDNNPTLHEQSAQAFESRHPGAALPFFGPASRSATTADTSNGKCGCCP